MNKYIKAPHNRRIKAVLIDFFLPFKWLLLTVFTYILINLTINFLGLGRFSAVSEPNPNINITEEIWYDTLTKAENPNIMFFLILDIIYLIATFASFIWIIIIFVRQIIQITKTGQTLGKKRMNLQIIDLRTGKPIKFGRYFLSRPLTIGLFEGISTVVLPSLLNLFNYSFILFDKEHRALHDKIWKTMVVSIDD